MEFPSQQLFLKVMAAHNRDPDAVYLAMDGYDKIRSAIAKKQHAISNEEDRHAKAIEKLNQEIAAVQKTCDHLDVTRSPDPSGGRDSSATCQICGAEV